MLLGSADGALQVRPGAAVQPKDIKKVHLVQACHLDVGFTDFSTNAINKYFEEYFPGIAKVGAELRNDNSTSARLVFTTHALLVSLFLDCPALRGARLIGRPLNTSYLAEIA